MALQINYTNALGVNYPTCYAKVSQFWGNGVDIHVSVNFYSDTDTTKQPIDNLMFILPYTDGMTISDLYSLIKMKEVFTSAIDV